MYKKLNPKAMRGGLLCWALIIILMGLCEFQPLLASVPRFAVDNENSRQIYDALEETGFPFGRTWSTPLGGPVESQPVMDQGRIYVFAGKRLVMLDQTGEILHRSPVLSESERPSAASPTLSWTPYGKRIYVATRDHRLWALDGDTLEPVWCNQSEPYLLLSAAGYPEGRYRITSSPLVILDQENPLLFLGTGEGDQTQLPNQVADNGFFAVKDLGEQAQVQWKRQFPGEVTGSPVQFGSWVIGTYNRGDQGGGLIGYDWSSIHPLEDLPETPLGLPGSPAVDGKRLYVADRQGQIHCYEKTELGHLVKRWKNPSFTDLDLDRVPESYSLRSPAIGEAWIYLPIQNYRGENRGALVAVDKISGQTKKVKRFEHLLTANVIYWMPSDQEDTAYVLVFEKDGSATLLDAKTLEPVYGFVDQAGKPQKKVRLMEDSGAQASPEPIIGENLLLLVDGAGVLHAFGGVGPINFTCNASQKRYSVEDDKEMIEVVLWVENRSKWDYGKVPLVLQPLSPAASVSDWQEDLFLEMLLDLPAGQTKEIKVALPVAEESRVWRAWINPEGHPWEKSEEIYPRGDNQAVFTIENDHQDLMVVQLKGPVEPILGKREPLEGVIRYSGPAETESDLVWYINGKEARRQRVNLKPGEYHRYTWLWEAPKLPEILTLSLWIDPWEEHEDVDRSNNKKDLQLVYEPLPPMPNCYMPLEQKNWTVTYPFITGYQKRDRLDCHVDPYGQLQCVTVSWTDYSSPIWAWQEVVYWEKLEAKVEIRTGQGEETNPFLPKTTDQAHRGAWEIIPYARTRGLDPERVTRAGYGFALKVTTKYQSDWENKIPVGPYGPAIPVGGNYSGPKKVWVDFYDTRGAFVRTTALERTGGSLGQGEAYWELPLDQNRRHQTAVNIPDGDYMVQIRVEGAGKHGLHTCLEEKVRIFGTMYDDQYIRYTR